MIKAILFDMDGVLLESEKLWIQAKSYVLKKYAIPHPHLLALQTIGLRLEEVVEYWYTHEPKLSLIDVHKKMLVDEITQSITYYYEKLSQPSIGLEQALILLKKEKLLLGVASVSPRHLIKAFLDKNKLANYFSTIISGESVQFSKPHPEIYLSLSSALHTPVDECLAIEDSRNGLLSAQSALMKSIFYCRKPLIHDGRTALATFSIRSFKDLFPSVKPLIA